MFTGASSPDDSNSSPIGNTFSSPGDAVRRRSRRRSTTPSAYTTPPPPPPQPHQSRFAASDANPALTPTPNSRRGRGRRAPSTTPIATTPSSTDDAAASSEGGDGYDADDARPTFVWGTNISVEDVNEAIYRFLKHFRESSSVSEDDGLLLEGKYETAIKRVLEVEGDSLDVDAQDVFGYDPDLYTKMVRYPLEVLAIFDIVLMNMVGRINPLFEKHIQTRIFNLKSSISMRNLNPSG
jgi:DNA replication licensing factor MCM4